MWDQLAAFLDYQAIRRHTESKLIGPNTVLAHISVFLLLTFIQLIYYLLLPRYDHFGDPGAGELMTGWSVLILLHCVWAYPASGAIFRTRRRAIEAELRERVERDDTELLNNPKQVFRIQGILDEDIRGRSWLLFLSFFLFLIPNALLWTAWVIYYQAATQHPWYLTVPLAAVTVLPAVIITRRRNRQHDEELAELLAGRTSAKQKRGAEDMYDLADDGEIAEDYFADHPVEWRKAKE